MTTKIHQDSRLPARNHGQQQVSGKKRQVQKPGLTDTLDQAGKSTPRQTSPTLTDKPKGRKLKKAADIRTASQPPDGAAFNLKAYNGYREALINHFSVLLTDRGDEDPNRPDPQGKRAADGLNALLRDEDALTGQPIPKAVHATINAVWSFVTRPVQNDFAELPSDQIAEKIFHAEEYRRMGREACAQNPRPEIITDLVRLNLPVAAMEWCDVLMKADVPNAGKYLGTLAQAAKEVILSAAFQRGHVAGGEDYYRILAGCAEELAVRAPLPQQKIDWLVDAAGSWLKMSQGASEARRLYKDVLAKDANNVVAWSGLADCQRRLGMPSASGASLALAAKHAATQRCGEQHITYMLNVAERLTAEVDLRDPETVVSHLHTAIQQSKATPTARAQALANLAQVCLHGFADDTAEQGDAHAVEYFLAALHVQGDASKRKAKGDDVWSPSTEDTLAFAAACERTGRAAEAKGVLREAVRSAPHALPLRRALLNVMRAAGTDQEISEAYQGIVGRDAHNTMLQRAAAKHFTEQRLWDPAAEAWQRIADDEPQNIDVRLQLSRAAGQSKRMRPWTLRALNQALEIDPHHVPTLLAFADVHTQQQQHRKAVERLEQAMTLDASPRIAAQAVDTVLTQIETHALASEYAAPCATLRNQVLRTHDFPRLEALLRQAKALLLEVATPKATPPTSQSSAPSEISTDTVVSQNVTEPQRDPLQIGRGRIIGVNYNDNAVVQQPNGKLVWLYDAALAAVWEQHRPDPLARIPADRRHTVSKALQERLDKTLQLAIVGQQTVGDYQEALVCHPKDVFLLRGSRVYLELLRHFAPNDADQQQAIDGLLHGEHPVDIDIATSVPPEEVQNRCIPLAPDHMGAQSIGGISTHVSTLYHGVTGFHDHKDAPLSMDISTLCTAHALSPRQFIEGGNGQVFPKVFGSDLVASAEYQDFAPLYYDFATKQIYDPMGTAWQAIQQGEMRLASKKALVNPMLALRAAKLTRAHLKLSAADLRSIRDSAQTLLAGKTDLAASLLARSAPGQLPNAQSLLTWVHETLHQNLSAMKLAHVYNTCFKPCTQQQLVKHYAQRHAHARRWQ